MVKVKRGTVAAVAKTIGKRDEPMRPPPEQLAKGSFVLQDIVDMVGRGQVKIGKAYRRQPKFEKIDGLGTGQLKALRYYRAAFDASEQSLIKSGLDIGAGGGSGGSHAAITRLEAQAFGGHTLRSIERHFGGDALTLLRDIALHDMTFSECAMKRFGARHLDYIVDGKPKRKMAPKSGAHRQIVRDEFMMLVGVLVEVLAPYLDARRC